MSENQVSHTEEYSGSYDTAGSLLASLNGESSLDLAYRLLDSGVTAEELSGIRENLADSFEHEFATGDHAPAEKLPAAVVAVLRHAAGALDSKGAALNSLFAAAADDAPDWRTFALVIRNVDRVRQHMTLISLFRKDPTHA